MFFDKWIFLICKSMYGFIKRKKIENKTFYEMIQYSVHENPNKKEL